MKIIIVGYGKVGSHLAKLLSFEDHQVTVIDVNRSAVEEAVDEYDVIGINGNGASFPIQEEAGVDGCDMFIAVTGNDELNIMSCMVADRSGAKRTIARVRNTDYSGHLLFLQNKLGVDLFPVLSSFPPPPSLKPLPEAGLSWQRSPLPRTVP